MSARPSQFHDRYGALLGCSLRGVLLTGMLLGLTFGGLEIGLWSGAGGTPTSPPPPTATPAAVAALASPTGLVAFTATRPPSPTVTLLPLTATPTVPPATATATQSPGPTLTPSLTPSPQIPVPPELWSTPTPFPSEVLSGTATPVTPVPTSVNPVHVNDHVVNILLLGSDRRPGDGAWRTDTMIVVSVDPDAATVSMLSVPRDLFVYIPGYGMNRINTVDRHGGPELVRQTLLYNLGIPIHFYARVNFDNFKSIVNAVGGVDVPVDCTLHDWRLKSPELDQNLPENWEVYTQTVGIAHMDGDLALWYARSRMTTNDFDRGRRQQKILRALYRTAREQNMLEHVPELWGAFHDSVETDLGIGDLLWLAGLGIKSSDNLRIRSYYLGTAVTNWTAPPNGAQVLIPDWTRMEPIVRGMFSPPAQNRGAQDQIKVEVWNGTGWDDAAPLAADRLGTEGFFPAIGTADRRDYPNTMIVDFTGATKGSKIPRLRELFNVPAERVVTQVDSASPYAYRLILGADYDSCRGARTGSSYVYPTRTPMPPAPLTPPPAPTPLDTPADTPVP